MAWIFYDAPVPMMFREPLYCNDGYCRRTYEEPAPISFREPPYYQDPVYYRDSPYYQELPYYDNGYYRIGRRDQYPVFSHGGYLIPREQILVRVEDPPRRCHNSGYPYAGCVAELLTTVELYVPQLLSDECQRRVGKCLDDMAGVVRVIFDQSEKKVVVVGRNLCPNDVLHRLQRDPHSDRSVFWADR